MRIFEFEKEIYFSSLDHQELLDAILAESAAQRNVPRTLPARQSPLSGEIHFAVELTSSHRDPSPSRYFAAIRAPSSTSGTFHEA